MRFLPRLVIVFLVALGLSLGGCSYIPWIGGDADEEDELGFESDAPFGEDASGSANSEDDFFADTGDQGGGEGGFDDQGGADDGFSSVDQDTDQNEIKANLENLQSQQEALISKVLELQEMINTMEPQIAATQEKLEGNLGSISEKADFLEPEVNELKDQMARLQQELAELKQKRSSLSGRSGSSARRVSSGFKQGYDKALESYRNGNYDESILLFQNLEVKNPPVSYQDNISFWIGSNYLQLEMYDDAIKSFQTVLTKYPRGNKVHDARFQLGVSYIRKGDTSRGVDTLEAALRGNPPAEVRAKIEQQLSEIQ
ncbi:MAG: tetratricopeptide repeat protein [Nitrospinales bacterium]